MELSLTTRPGRGCVVVRIGGDLDLATTPNVQSSLQRAIDGGARTVVLDLTDVRFIDSTALGMVVWLHKELHERGGHVAVAGAQPIVLHVLEITSVDTLIRLYDTVAAAEDDVSAGEKR